jgi:hypothetical protein
MDQGPTSAFHVIYIPVGQGKRPGTHFIGDWVGLRADLDWHGGEKISPPLACEFLAVKSVASRHTDVIPAPDSSLR